MDGSADGQAERQEGPSGDRRAVPGPVCTTKNFGQGGSRLLCLLFKLKIFDMINLHVFVLDSMFFNILFLSTND